MAPDKQKSIKENLLVSEVRYRKLFETAKDGILIIDPVTDKIIDANPYLLTLIGYSLEETIGKKLSEIGAFRDIEAAKAMIIELHDKGYVRYEDLPLKTKDGREIEVEFVSNLYTVNASMSMIQCNIRNITERKIAEKEAQATLKTMYDRFHQIADNIDEVFFLATIDSEVLYVNPAFERMFGISLDTIAKDPKAWASVVLAEDRAEFFKPPEETLKSGSNFLTEFRIKRPDGDIRWIQVKTGLVKDEQGVVNRFVGIASDITEMKQEAGKSAELDVLKNKFIQIVSHQMRTPLGAIRWNLESLLGGELGGKLNPEHQDVLRVIYNSDLSILSRLDDLILTLDIENKAIKLEKERTNLRQLIESLIIEYSPFINLRKLKIDLKVPDSKYPVDIDINKVKQALGKIIDNAIRYNKEGGAIKIVLEEKDQEVYVAISDEGIGIPAVEKDRVFGKFFRASNATTMSPDASGLGLFIAKNIIESHGGALWFNSREGVGSDFYFKLPIAK